MTIAEPIPDFLKVENRGKPMAQKPPERSSKPLVHSFSSLNCYAEVCPFQYYHRYVLKSVKFVETPAVKYGNEVHTAFEQRLGPRKRPLPPHMNQWEAKYAAPFDKYKLLVEIKLGVTREGKSCDFFANDVWLRGKIDCVALNGAAAYLPDWKSGNSNYEKKFELEVNALLLQARHPEIRTIKGRFAWLKDDRWGDEHNLSDTEFTWSKVNTLANMIETDLSLPNFQKKPSGLCGYCDVVCEHNKKKS